MIENTKKRQVGQIRFKWLGCRQVRKRDDNGDGDGGGGSDAGDNHKKLHKFFMVLKILMFVLRL